jgi:hypothetical protein
LCCREGSLRLKRRLPTVARFYQDEYLVYDESQVALRYMVKLRL